jgi:hypothetical protein
MHNVAKLLARDFLGFTEGFSEAQGGLPLVIWQMPPGLAAGLFGIQL